MTAMQFGITAGAARRMHARTRKRDAAGMWLFAVTALACSRSPGQPGAALDTGAPGASRSLGAPTSSASRGSAVGAASPDPSSTSASRPGAEVASALGSSAVAPAVATGAGCGENMLPIPAGKFDMGSNDAKNSKYWIDLKDPSTFPGLDEGPVHTVKVQSFCIDKTEVTVGAYRACVQSSKCTEPSLRDAHCTWSRKDHDDHPIDCVTFTQATQYCAAFGKRLPTEEEWEYAARGTDGRRFPWGNTEPEFTLTDVKPGFCWRDNATCSVNQFPGTKSPFGVLNMVDNVSEWTSSFECSYATGACTKKRIARGGSVSGHEAGIRAAYREAHPELGLGAPRIGFRCAR